jgi:hypothetical protein
MNDQECTQPLLQLAVPWQHAPDLEARIAVFTARHGAPPDERTTFRQWAEVTPDVGDLLRLARYIGPSGQRISVVVAYKAALRALTIFSGYCPGDSRPSDALALVGRWLAGERIGVEVLFQAARAVRDGANSAATPQRAGLAAHAAYHAAKAVVGAIMCDPYAVSWSAGLARSAAAELASDGDLECALQRAALFAELDRLEGQ